MILCYCILKIYVWYFHNYSILISQISVINISIIMSGFQVKTFNESNLWFSISISSDYANKSNCYIVVKEEQLSWFP